jgi:hypothetical protein
MIKTEQVDTPVFDQELEAGGVISARRFAPDNRRAYHQLADHSINRGLITKR